MWLSLSSDQSNLINLFTGELYKYEYDPVGNRLRQIINGDTTNYLYDAANRLAPVDGQNYNFDANGNLLRTDTLSNTFDAANRLVTTYRATTTLQVAYNGLGDRVAQTVGITTTSYALDVQGLPEVIYTSEGNSYLHLPGVIMAESSTGEVRYLLSDGLGSVRQAVDETGAVVAYNEFDPYGNPVENGSEVYGFTGEWWQNEVGLLHLRARWLLPETGTFLSRDPVEGEPAYQYVRGNPVNRVDPPGMAPSPKNACQTGKCEITDYHFDYEHIHLGEYSNLPNNILGDFSNTVVAQHKAGFRKFVSLTFEGNEVDEDKCYVVQYAKGVILINDTDEWSYWPWSWGPIWPGDRPLEPYHEWKLDNLDGLEGQYPNLKWNSSVNTVTLLDGPGPKTDLSNPRSYYTKYKAELYFTTFIFDKSSLPSLSAEYFRQFEGAELNVPQIYLKKVEWSFAGVEGEHIQGWLWDSWTIRP